jgi:hypothetical protein
MKASHYFVRRPGTANAEQLAETAALVGQSRGDRVIALKLFYSDALAVPKSVLIPANVTFLPGH